MAERSIPQGFVSPRTAAFPQMGQGVYIGAMPGSSNIAPYSVGYKGYSGAEGIGVDTGIMLQTDTGYISTISNLPQNVFRLTTSAGISYIQGSNIGFATPYTGNVGVRILPSTNQINVNNINFVSTIATGGSGAAGTINMTQLTSTIKGYNWAQVF